jgi:hypothetical protein
MTEEFRLEKKSIEKRLEETMMKVAVLEILVNKIDKDLDKLYEKVDKITLER